ncbi:MAG: class I SAM-dependent RNA methyltransferase, partial [Deltaproteobacteria bacterium]|nr:class I SAM-dependent RNA methyltransferase [Deltaproteobacteria bacterium]
RVYKVKRSYLNAKLIDIITPAPERREPPCPQFLSCGGCQWQHMQYDTQLYWKKRIVQDCCERIGGLRDFNINDTLPCPDQLGYRHRAGIKVSQGQKPDIGFFKAKTHDVIDITTCPLLVPQLNQALNTLRRMVQKNPSGYASLTDIDLLYSLHDDIVLLSMTANGSRMSDLLYSGDKLGPIDRDVQEKIEDLLFLRDTRNFYQVNYAQNKNMLEHVR